MKMVLKRQLMRFAAMLLTFCMLAGVVPAMPALAADAVTVALPAQFVEVGQTAQLKLTDSAGKEVSASGLTFKSADTSIATVSSEGAVTGVKIGRVKISVSGGYVGEVEIPVVGENLMTRNGVKNGVFEGGVVYASAYKTTNYWQAYTGGNYMAGDNYSAEVISRVGPLGNTTNVLKLTSKAADTSASYQQFSLRSATTPVTANGNNQWGGHEIGYGGKIYELSGWAKAENTTALHKGWGVRTYVFAKSNEGAYTMFQNATNATQVAPFKGKSGNQDWTHFATAPIVMDELKDFELLLCIRIEGNHPGKSGGWGGDLLFSDISLHEVQYDKITLTTADAIKDMAVGDTATTETKHYSTTGRELVYLTLSSVTDAGVPATVTGTVPVTYKSSNEAVATVSKEGVITAVKGGTATITASATVGGVTRSAQLAVSVAGGTDLDSINLEYPVTAVGKTVSPKLTGKMTDGSALDAASATVSYASANTAVATVNASTGAVTGVKAGYVDITATVTHNGITKTGVYRVCVSGTELYNAGKDVTYHFENSTGWTGGTDLRNITAQYTDGWSVHSWLKDYASNPSRTFYQANGTWLQVNFATAGDWAAFNVPLTTKGLYTATFTNKTYGSSGVADLFFIPPIEAGKSVADYIADDTYKVAQVNFYKSGSIADTLDPAKFTVAAEKTGDYLFVLKKVSGSNMFMFTTLEFDGGDAPAKLASLSLSYAGTVEAGKTAQPTVSGKMDNGDDADLTGAVRYTSDNTEIATVDAATGVVTGIKSGFVGITAEATINGVTKTANARLFVTPVDAKPAGRSVSYDFTYRDSSWTKANTVGGVELEDVRNITAQYTDGWSTYAWLKDYASNTNRTYYQPAGAWMQVNMSAPGDWVAFNTPLPRKGMYDVEFYYDTYSNSGIANLHLIPAPADANADKKEYVSAAVASRVYKAATVNFKASGTVTEVEEPVKFSFYAENSGDYIFALEFVSGGSSQIFESISFNGGTGPEFDSVSLSYPMISIGANASPTISGKMADGSDAEFDGAVYEYTSSNSAVASVDKTTGVINGVAAGIAEINVKVTLDGVTKTVSAKVRVTKTAISNAGVDFTYQIKNRSTNWTKEMTDSGDANDIRKMTVEYTDGWYLYDWDDAIFDGVTDVYAKTTFYQYNGSYFRTDMKKVGQWVAIAITVPQKGIYSLKIDHMKYKTGGAADIYLVPMPKDSGDIASLIRNDTYKVGNINAYDVNATKAADDSVTYTNVIAETAGDYLVVFKQSDVSTGRYLMLKTMSFMGGTAKPILNVSGALKQDVYTGKSVSIPLRISHSQDSALDYTAANVTVDWSKSGIAEAVAVKSADGVVLNVTGLKQGSTKLTAEIEIGGVSGIYQADIKVEDITLKLALKAQFVEVGGKAVISATDNRGTPMDITGYTFVSENTDIATVSGNVVTGISMGLATIKAIGDVTVTIDVPVVGENLLTRNGVKNGNFEGGMTWGSTNANVFWNVVKAQSGNYMWGPNYNAEIVTGKSAVMESTPMLKLTSTETTPGAASSANMVFSFRSGAVAAAEGTQFGFVEVDPEKMYELSGWVKAENTKNLHNSWSVRTYAYGIGDEGTVVFNGTMTAMTQVFPFKGKKGDQDWTYFSIPNINNDELKGYRIALQPRIEGGILISAGGWVGDLYFSDLSLHEVRYEKMEFAAAASTTDLAQGTRISTSIKHYSNTGKELKHSSLVSVEGGVAATAEGKIPVTYTSADPFVARVDEAGVITAVGGGETLITATTTVAGVTRSKTIPVTVAGEAASRELKDVTVSFLEGDVRKGMQATPVVTGTMTDGKEAFLKDAQIEFIYDESALSYDAESGKFTALKVGATEVSARVTLLGVTRTSAKKSLNIRVAALVSAALEYPSDIISVDGELMPQVTGVLSDGSAANIADAKITYTSSDSNIISVSENGMIIGVNIGSAVITAKVDVDGVVQSASFALRVTTAAAMEDSDARVVLDLDSRNTVWNNIESGYANDIRGITDEYTGNWSWYGNSSDLNPGYSTFYQYNNSYLRVSMSAVNQWFAIQTEFPAAGRYRSVLDYSKYYSAGAADIYVIPVPGEGETVEQYLTDYYKVGNFNVYDIAGSVTPAIAILDDVLIPNAGKYLVVFKQSSIEKGKYLMLNKLTFSGACPAVKVTSSAANALMIGEQIKLEPGIEWENEIPEYVENYTMSFANNTPEVIDVSEDGTVTALKNGIGEVAIRVEWNGKITEGICGITVGTHKTRRSFYTDEKVANARNNIARYSWAKALETAAVKEADKLIGNEEVIWNLVTTQELPRSAHVGYRKDPNYSICVYCGADLKALYGTSSWDTDPLGSPWKVQCLYCRRKFPSNDFGGFYKLGIDENGNWSYQQALDQNAKLVAEGKPGYLVNVLYPEKEGTLDNAGNPIIGWGVDDGWGFKINGECKSFIAHYNHTGIWSRVFQTGLTNLKNAYLYTGNAKYGRLGAIIIDRIADVYPDMDTTECGALFLVADGNSSPTSRGKINGKISDYNLSLAFAEAYDAFWPATSDPQVIDFLSKKAAQYNLSNPKSSQAAIVGNIENNLIREINRSVRDYRINSNFGHHQRVLLTAAIALDTMPETKEWIDFTFQSGGRESNFKYTGGNVYAQLVNDVDRDGHGNEAAPAYNSGWVTSTMLVADAVSGYDKYPAADLYKNPKFVRMLTSEMDVLCASTMSPNIADNNAMGNGYNATSTSVLIRAYELLGTPEIARAIYIRNGYTTKNLHGDIFDAEPEAMVKDIEKAVEGTTALGIGSRNLTGYGFAILRDGDWVMAADSTRDINTQRDFYIQYGKTQGHGHPDKLTLGVHAYGLDVGADVGTPELKITGDPHRDNFIEQTLPHNTVVVDNTKQVEYQYGDPLHFDDSGMVKLMDVSAPGAYAQVDEYRRTLVMVNADDEISYGVDFFHVSGGKDHVYSFHGLGDTAELEGVVTTAQADEDGNYVGSYKGRDVKWGEGSSVESWFGQVDTAKGEAAAVDSFSMDWKITDYYRILKPAQKDLRMRLTMVNSFKLDEISAVSGIPPQVDSAPKSIRYLFARHTGENDGIASGAALDSLFTSVVEPYNRERYIQSIENVSVVRADGAEFTMDEAKAVKVTLTNGRADYIVYAKDTSVEYFVDYKGTDDQGNPEYLFDFCGFVGVVSVFDGKFTYTYLNDGTKIAAVSDITPAYTGTVTGFSEEMTFNNYIDAVFSSDVDVNGLAGEYIYIDNTNAENAVYRIESAEIVDGAVRLHLGNTTLINSYKDNYNFDAGFNYNIAKGDSFRIPVTYLDDSSPIFHAMTVKSVVAGKNASLLFTADSPLGLDVTYRADALPRGASFDSESGIVHWKPDNNQLGANIIKVVAVDTAGRESAYITTVNVFQSSGGSKPNSNTQIKPPVKDDEEDPKPETGKDDVENTDTPEETKGFTDLGGYDWAKDAIDNLAEQGVVNGTSATTFAPGKNITRADFALMMVRAFKLESDSTENFADVDPNAYYAEALAIGKANGILNGVGNDKYNPTATITRQDMMTVVSRALKALGYELKAADEDTLAAFVDAATIADYASEHVATLVANELVKGKTENTIDPKAYTTRAEVAVLIERLMNTFLEK